MTITVFLKKGQVDFRVLKDGIKILGGYLGEMKIKESPLFSVRLKNVDSLEEKIIDSSCKWEKVNAKQDASVFTFQNPDKINGLTIEFNLIKTNDYISWVGKVINENKQWSVMDIDYPTPTLYAEDFTLFVPHASGIAFKNAGKRGYEYDYFYPSSKACMQYFATYTNKNGVYVAVEDGKAAIKNFKVVAKDDVCMYKLTLIAPDASLAENSFQFFGECKWQVFDGDWFDATMLYSKFVTEKANWLPEIDENGRKDLSDKYKDVAFWITDCMPNSTYHRDNVPTSLVIGTSGYTNTYWKDAPILLRKELGVPIAYHVYLWHEIPFNIEYPHFLPARKDFIEGAKQLRENGIYVVPYINGVSWETRDGVANHEVNFDNTGIDGAVINENGEISVEKYPQTTIKGDEADLAPICPTFNKWREIIKGVSEQMHKTLPIDGIYFDEIAAHRARRCYNKKHNHTKGGGTYWADGYNKLMEEIKEIKPKDNFYFTECNAEPYMKGFDGFLSWYWMADEQVPAFSALYGGYVQFIGRYMLGKKKNDLEFFKYNIAQSLVYGQQLGWHKADVVYNEQALKFLKPVVQMRHKYNFFFANAKMLRPPVITCNLAEKITTPALHHTEMVHMEQVLGGLWQSRKDGKIVLFVVNISEESAKAKIKFKLEDKSRAVPFEMKGGEYVADLELEPYAVKAFEF